MFLEGLLSYYNGWSLKYIECLFYLGSFKYSQLEPEMEKKNGRTY